MIGRALVLACGLLAMSTTAMAQTNSLFEKVLNADLTPQQSEALAALQKSPTASKVEVVRINPKLLFDNTHIKLDIGQNLNVTMTGRAFDVKNPNVYSWTGQTEGAVPQVSTFFVQGQNVTGTVFSNQGIVRVRPIGGGLHALINVDTSKFPQDDPPPKAGDKNNLKDSAPLEKKTELDPAVTKILVLVAYSKDVAEKRGQEVGAIAGNAISITNTSYAASGVNAHLELSPSSPVAVEYHESGSFDKDVDFLKSPNDPAAKRLREIRDKDKANIIVMLVENASYCGLAGAIMADRTSAVAAVNYDCAVDNLSFAHEVGHLQGARHNLGIDATETPFRYGHGFYNAARSVRTIMSYACPTSTCTRMPQWSRPNAWGSADHEHNSRVLNETAKTVSTF